MGRVDGEDKQIFGWHTLAVGDYTDFLKAFIPDLTRQLEDWGLMDETYFHISDVPREEHLETYTKSFDSVKDIFKALKTIEAVAFFEYYEKGLIKGPVAATHAIHEFIDKDVEDLWAYYCLYQSKDVSNRFIAMPSARNRILGVQLYKYDIKGFLHWGYNFYNSERSIKKLNPFESTDADQGLPAGDTFLVYPGEDKKPLESIRSVVLGQAFADYRALRLLEDLTSRDHVLGFIDEGLAEPLTFTFYPKEDGYLITLRNRVNAEIAKAKRG